MTDDPREELSEEELEEQDAERLPDREQMSTIRVPFEPVSGLDPGGGYVTLPVEPDT
jgi:hypothetical protein